jgi:hypothetical protein
VRRANPKESLVSPILIANDAGSKQLATIPPLDSISILLPPGDLEAGDVCFTGRSHSGDVLIGIEVKSISDLIDSISSGRLAATQIPKMHSTYDVSWLVYYGDYRYEPRTGSLQVRRRASSPWENYSNGNGYGNRKPLSWSSLEAFLTSPGFTSFNIHVKHCLTIEDVAYWIACVHAVWQKDPSAHKSFRCFDTTRSMPSRPPGDLDRVTHQIAWTASTLPSIRYERGVAAARHFMSLRAMFCADARAWCAVPGIGPTIADGAVRAITTTIDPKHLPRPKP